jgi:hypothetical protein
MQLLLPGMIFRMTLALPSVTLTYISPMLYLLLGTYYYTAKKNKISAVAFGEKRTNTNSLYNLTQDKKSCYNKYLQTKGLNMSEQPIDTEVQNMNDNLGAVIYIMLGRIYDLLVLIADSQNKGEDVLKLMELHRQGNIMSPLPALNVPDFESEESSSTSPENKNE